MMNGWYSTHLMCFQNSAIIFNSWLIFYLCLTMKPSSTCLQLFNMILIILVVFLYFYTFYTFYTVYYLLWQTLSIHPIRISDANKWVYEKRFLFWDIVFRNYNLNTLECFIALGLFFVSSHFVVFPELRNTCLFYK